MAGENELPHKVSWLLLGFSWRCTDTSQSVAIVMRPSRGGWGRIIMEVKSVCLYSN